VPAADIHAPACLITATFLPVPAGLVQYPVVAQLHSTPKEKKTFTIRTNSKPTSIRLALITQQEERSRAASLSLLMAQTKLDTVYVLRMAESAGQQISWKHSPTQQIIHGSNGAESSQLNLQAYFLSLASPPLHLYCISF
jgi:triphosphoribosyl-dephospho-CoA synthetase